MSERLVETEHRVTPLELFFDLVFVFGFTQVTTLLHEDPSWGGIGRSVLVLSALWWAWGELRLAHEHRRRRGRARPRRDAGRHRGDVHRRPGGPGSIR